MNRNRLENALAGMGGAIMATVVQMVAVYALFALQGAAVA